MNFLQLAKSRFSIRKYKSTPVEKEKLVQVLEAGQHAPSAVNFQPWHFIVVDDISTLEKVHTAYPREWIKQAPLIIVACSDHSQSWKRTSDKKDSADIDISIAVDHMTLMATQLGLGTCWVCNFDVQKCSDILELPEHVEPVVILPLGYPDITIPAKKRKPLQEIVHRNKFGNSFS